MYLLKQNIKIKKNNKNFIILHLKSEPIKRQLTKKEKQFA